MSGKNELLDELETVFVSQKKLGFGYYSLVMGTLIFALMFAFPKIYIQQQIYFKSREIYKLKIEYDTLKEENKIISASVESIKFKNQILDTLF
jgi:cell division protein FtsL